jgi:hypothetical protein
VGLQGVDKMIVGNKHGTAHVQQNEFEWHRWYAWRPIRLEDGRFVWLEAVERKLTAAKAPVLIADFWKYRTIEEGMRERLNASLTYPPPPARNG